MEGTASLPVRSIGQKVAHNQGEGKETRPLDEESNSTLQSSLIRSYSFFLARVHGVAMVNTGSHIQSFKNEYLLGTHNESGMQSVSKKAALVLEIRPFQRR